MMGLGKRFADSFYQNGKNEDWAAEFAKRKEYLEDTGMLNSADGLNKLSSPD